MYEKYAEVSPVFSQTPIAYTILPLIKKHGMAS